MSVRQHSLGTSDSFDLNYTLCMSGLQIKYCSCRMESASTFVSMDVDTDGGLGGATAEQGSAGHKIFHHDVVGSASQLYPGVVGSVYNHVEHDSTRCLKLPSRGDQHQASSHSDPVRPSCEESFSTSDGLSYARVWWLNSKKSERVRL